MSVTRSIVLHATASELNADGIHMKNLDERHDM